MNKEIMIHVAHKASIYDYNLKAFIRTIGIQIINHKVVFQLDINDEDLNTDFKLCLKPLSSLTKKENWEPLLDMLIERGIYKNTWSKGHESFKARILNKSFGKMFKLSNHDDWVIVISLTEPDRCKALIYNWLLDNQYDVFGLIPLGLAKNIDEI